MPALQCEHLSKIYRGGIRNRREIRALEELSLTVDSGQIFSLLGPNGAGKTTFIKILLSLTHPTSGSASVLGRPVTEARVRRKIGYLPENHRFPGYLTGQQVLSSFGRLSGVNDSRLRSRIDDLLILVGMQQWRNIKIRKYSKGMMQRLGLAQALVNDPDLLFLDEPTDGVDPVGRKEIRDVLRGLRDEGKTIFLNSHLLSEVELISDRVAILDHGKLLKVGTVEELTTTEASYLIGYEGALPEALLTEAAARVLGISTSADGIVAHVTDPASLNAVIDVLRKHHVLITSVGQQRNTLEDSFISLIKREVSA
jgi:ABC-2 type transport system ATP-binding protein